jgi:hypothetical protein
MSDQNLCHYMRCHSFHLLMLFGQITTCHLKSVATGLWNAPIPCDPPCFYFVEIVGTIKTFHMLLVLFLLLKRSPTVDSFTVMSHSERSYKHTFVISNLSWTTTKTAIKQCHVSECKIHRSVLIHLLSLIPILTCAT